MTSAIEQPSDLVVPNYGDGGNASVIPAVTWGVPTARIPDAVVSAPRCVVLVLDSLGWMQLQERRERAPTLLGMQGGPVTTSAPSTTATALTTISTGVPPGEHGIVGYRFPVGGAVMNALRWKTPAGDHRGTVAPREVQPVPPLGGGGQWQVVSDRQFVGSAFTEAYLGDIPYTGVWHPSSLAAATRERLDDGATHVYAYYDGLDHVAHVHGFEGSFYDLELGFCDWLVSQMIDALPPGTALVVTADHGQIQAPDIIAVAPEVAAMSSGRSGEARFRWLHARAGAVDELAAAAQEHHGDLAWIRTKDQVIDEGWFGANVSNDARNRLGDVALVAQAPVGFEDSGEPHLGRLTGRHGSLTAAEMLVPVLHHVAD